MLKNRLKTNNMKKLFLTIGLAVSALSYSQTCKDLYYEVFPEELEYSSLIDEHYHFSLLHDEQGFKVCSYEGLVPTVHGSSRVDNGYLIKSSFNSSFINNNAYDVVFKNGVFEGNIMFEGFRFDRLEFKK